ncbi:unnamed protein product, partial [Heterotrigona itama]
FTCWPPAPDAFFDSIIKSFSSNLTSISLGSGKTDTTAVL